MLIAIVACEIGFWVLLGTGLMTRYALHRRGVSNVLLMATPLVDVALLVFTVVDLRSGTTPNPTHSLAAVYIGFSVAFGHDLIRWADRKAAHRWAGGPPLPPKPASGTPERARKEWHDWGHALLGAAVAGVLIGGMVVLVGDRPGKLALFGFLPGLGTTLTVWLLGWTIPESVKARRAVSD